MKRQSAIFLFIIFIVTSSLFVTQPNSIVTEITDVAEKIDVREKINNLQDIIKRNSLKVDSNNDKISDSLNQDQDMIDAIILFEDFSFIPSSFQMGGISILENFKTLPALHVAMDSGLLSIVSKLPGVAVIEENLKLEPQLAYSTSQLGVRPFLWDQGLTGSSGYSIAVVDTGIDFSHSAFEGRIIASYNALNNNATLAIDTDGHGTHVAGIATGFPITDNTYTQTARGTLPSTGFFADILWANVNVSSSITVGMDWGAKGADNPGGTASILLVKESGGSFVLASGTNVELDTTGYFEVTFSGIDPGDYYVGFGNQGGAEDLDYEGWATLTYDSELPSQEIEDGYEEYSGVAPGVNIVAVKVIDGNGDGSTNDFLNAIDWIIDNKLTYNITVINLSLGITIVQATLDAQIAVLANNGIISVVAAGNDGKNSGGVFSPGSAEEAITVGALNRYNEIASYSSNGNFNSEPALSKPDIVAPGGSTAFPSITAFSHDSSYAEGLGLIIAPDSNNVGVNEKTDDLTALQGTSMASPHVAGLALLLVEKYSSQNTWQWNSEDVFRIKRAILAGSFEVANIGSAGGETVESPDQTPSIQRTGKDNVEGWGAVNGQAALGALSDSITFNQDIILSFNLEDPFASNVFAWDAILEAGTDYSFEAVVPAGVDVDLVIFDANTGNFGELQVLFSSTNGSGVNEEIVFRLAQSKEVMLIARLVDSSSPLIQMDVVTVRMNNPNFIPNVTITHPATGSFVNTPIVNVEFTSQTNSADAYVDDVLVGTITSGDPLPAITEGSHNLTLVEENTLLSLKDTDQSLFTLDLTKPSILSSNITNLDGLSVEDPTIFSFSVDDDLNLARIELRVDSELGSSITIGSKPFSGTIEFNPRSFLPGVRTVELRVYDRAGNYDNITITIDLVHSTFLIPQTDYTYEAENEKPLVITWVAGTNTSLNYIIKIDGVIEINEIWDGGNVEFTLPTLDIGQYNIEIQVFDVNGKNAKDQIIVTVFDTLAPRIAGPSSGEYDATFLQELSFNIEEAFPHSIKILIDDVLVQAKTPWDGDQAFSTFVLEGEPGDQNDVKAIVTDSSNNEAIYSLVIDWIDDTAPNIISPQSVEFTQGKAPNDLIWTWEEKFQSKVTLSLDRDVIISLDSNVNSLSISRDELNNLASGTHRFEIIVTETGGNNYAEDVSIIVNKKSNQAGFIPSISFIQSVVALASLILIIRIQKTKSK